MLNLVFYFIKTTTKTAVFKLFSFSPQILARNTQWLVFCGKINFVFQTVPHSCNTYACNTYRQNGRVLKGAQHTFVGFESHKHHDFYSIAKYIGMFVVKNLFCFLILKLKRIKFQNYNTKKLFFTTNIPIYLAIE